MFFFTNYTVINCLGALGLCLGLALISEVSRRYKWVAIGLYILLPILFTLVVWPKTTANGSSGGTWFAWVKTYSALAGVLIFMLIRYNKKLSKSKIMLTMPMLILAINIAEAIAADLEIYFAKMIQEGGLIKIGGPWNVINAIAGLLSILTMTGWLGIRVSKRKSRDMIWADQLWFWIIAYDLWNISYCYNAIPERSFYSGVSLIVVASLLEFYRRKGAWLQHRAQTLAIFAMFSLTFDYSSWGGWFTITTTHAVAPKYILSILALLANLGVAIYEIRVILKTKDNPLKGEIYQELSAYQNILSHNDLT